MTKASVEELARPIDLIHNVDHELFRNGYRINGVGLNSYNNNYAANHTKAQLLIGRALYSHVSQVDHELCEAGEEDSFFVADLGEVYRMFQTWKSHLPRVQPYYAVKCNTDLNVIRLLAKLGANFDCASKGEIDTVLSLGVTPDRIVYANPCKTNSFIRHARNTGVDLTTFDNADELYKIAKFHPNSDVLLRLATDDESAQCRLSTKFGAMLSSAPSLLHLAKKLGINVVGVSFHIGSGANDFESLVKAVRDSRYVFDEAEKLGFEMNVLDVGGGFSLDSFNESSRVLSYSLDAYFPESENSHVRIISEPGRFFVASAFTLATHVIARRDETAQANPMIYINDGVYGNMNCILFDHQNPEPFVLSHKNQFLYNSSVEDPKVKMSIWGPTCDGLDCIAKEAYLSHSVSVGDWLYFPNLGAYTSAASTAFNGFKANANVIYVSSENLSHLDLDIESMN